MPSIALSQKKIYRASPARRHDRKLRDTQPARAEVDLNPQTAMLVNTAQPAVEVLSTSQIAPAAQPTSVTKSPDPKTRLSKVKAAARAGLQQSKTSLKKPKSGLKKIKTATLRRSALKAARETRATNSQKTNLSSPEAISTTQAPVACPPKTSEPPVITQLASPMLPLKDGDCIQIRPHRSRPTIAPSPAPAVVPATTQKSANTLKKRTKRAAKPRRRFRFHHPSRAELINAESRLGSTIFGPIPTGHRREFFHDRENIWIWHESWTDSGRHARQVTVRYEVRPSGVYKKLSAGKYFKLEGAELDNFRRATRSYLQIIKQNLYQAV